MKTYKVIVISESEFDIDLTMDAYSTCISGLSSGQVLDLLPIFRRLGFIDADLVVKEE